MYRATVARRQQQAGLAQSLKPPHLFDQQRAGCIPFRCEAWKREMLHLYRTVLKAHDVYLEHEAQREFGGKFVKAEFHRHASTNAKYAAIFYKSWFEYVIQLEVGQTSRSLTHQELGLLNEEQKDRLNALRAHVIERRMEDGTLNTSELAATHPPPPKR